MVNRTTALLPAAAIPLAVAAAVFLTGCGTLSRGSTEGSNAPPASERRCPGGPARPITIDEVVAAAASHRIELHQDPTCADPNAVAQVANILMYGPHANRDEEDEIMPEQGDVTCFVTAQVSGRKVERVHYEGDVETSFRLANLECIIYPDEDHADEQLARLQATLDDLAAKL